MAEFDTVVCLIYNCKYEMIQMFNTKNYNQSTYSFRYLQILTLTTIILVVQLSVQCLYLNTVQRFHKKNKKLTENGCMSN